MSAFSLGRLLFWGAGAGGVGYTGYTSGYLEKWSGFDSSSRSSNNSNNNGGSFANQQQQQQYPQQPQVIVYEPSSNNNSGRGFWLWTGGSALLALAGYYYYIHKYGTKQVINKVEETAEQTQDLVVKTDKNNEERFNQLDARNTERAQTLETEIRSETRAGFQMVSEQLYALTQVCIQTLGAIAHGNQEHDAQGEFSENGANNTLLSYADRAQEMADTLISEEAIMQKRQQSLQDIRAEVHARAPISTQHIKNMNAQHITAGGPDSHETPMGPDDDLNNGNNRNNNNNIFDCDANQTPYLTNLSYKDVNLNDINNNNNNNQTAGQAGETRGRSNDGSSSTSGGSLMKTIGMAVVREKLKSYGIDTSSAEKWVDDNKFYLGCGTLAVVWIYGSVNLFYPNNENNNNNNYRYNNNNQNRMIQTSQ